MGSSFSSSGNNLGGFNPSSGPPMGGNGGPFQPTRMGVGPNPLTQGGNIVPFQQPPLGPGHMLTLLTKVSQWYPWGIHTKSVYINQ